MAKTTVSPAIILRRSAATTTPYATVERRTRPLIKLGKFISRRRRILQASDLRSLIHAILGGIPTDAAEIHSNFSELIYKTSWPAAIDQAPAFGDGTWGEILDRLIEGPIHPSAPLVGQISQPGVTANDDPNVGRLPHLIEFSLNPLEVILVWLDPQGRRLRQDLYGSLSGSFAQPCGAASMLVRKSFLDSRLISVAGEILRDDRPRTKRQPSARKVGVRRA